MGGCRHEHRDSDRAGRKKLTLKRFSCINILTGENIMVTDLEKLSRAVADATPERIVERELQEKAKQIQETLLRGEVYEDRVLGVRISATVPAR
jgi:hypothetical protein